MSNKLNKLLEIAKTEGKVEYTESEHQNNVYKFIIDNNITNGNMKYNKHFVYLLYVIWSKNKKYTVSKKDFHFKFRKHIKATVANYYKLNDFKIPIDDVRKEIVKLILKRAEKNEKEKKSSES